MVDQAVIRMVYNVGFTESESKRMLALPLKDGEHKIQPGLYQHYKGPQYRVFGTAQHSETEEWLVVYQALYGAQGFWVRPLTMFTESVAIDGENKPRFLRIGD
jgi:hypothetical protein